MTFDQGSFKDFMQGLDHYDSIDLKNATDRFPIGFISGVLEGHLPRRYLEA